MQHLSTEKQFKAEAQLKSFDRRHRQVINYNITQYHHSVVKGKLQYADLEQARRLAKHIKWATIEHLDKHLLHFEQQITARGAQVIWASNAAEALTAIENIVRRHQAQRIVKSKTMISEELGLNEFLEHKGLSVLETDLGEYVAQLAGEKPYHIVTPIMQKSKQDVADLFHKQFGTPITDTPEQTMAFVRTQLRAQMHNADIGISGANFLIAETGSLVLTENEGNIRLCTTFPKVHIAIAGIERVLPKLAHLDVFLPLLATFGTGQKLTTYNTLISGARFGGSELDGPEHLYVILLDNGRTSLLADEIKRETLYCIRCGACLNACPVYKTVGGHTYQTPYTGPIGALVMPALAQEQPHQYNFMSEATSHCGACTQACPVNIRIHDLLLVQRYRNAATKDQATHQLWNNWQKLMLGRRFWWNKTPTILKKKTFEWLFGSTWGLRRTLPAPAKQSFNEWWRKHKMG